MLCRRGNLSEAKGAHQSVDNQVQALHIVLCLHRSTPTGRLLTDHDVCALQALGFLYVDWKFQLVHEPLDHCLYRHYRHLAKNTEVICMIHNIHTEVLSIAQHLPSCVKRRMYMLQIKGDIGTH